MADDLTDGLLDALIATPLGNVVQRRRAKRLTAEYQAGRSVTVPASYCARPQDSRRSGELTASDLTTRWRPAVGADSVPVAAVVAERLVGTERQGSVVFSLGDGAELTVAAVHADVVRMALTDPTRNANPAGGS